LDLTTDPGDVSIETGSGDVELRLPASVGAEVELETGSGDIHTDFPLQVTRAGEDALEGRLGDGRGRLEIETGSGDVSLLKR
ncbi:MAG TPA: DUF4097 family beta strand repeat-containing protein, partial [Gemmatimonadales bacterium]|nr:DUF4097 family beta strand repeat-containing protein [Gemmatimonadales bacterium]